MGKKFDPFLTDKKDYFDWLKFGGKIHSYIFHNKYTGVLCSYLLTLSSEKLFASP